MLWCKAKKSLIFYWNWWEYFHFNAIQIINIVCWFCFSYLNFLFVIDFEIATYFEFVWILSLCFSFVYLKKKKHGVSQQHFIWILHIVHNKFKLLCIVVFFVCLLIFCWLKMLLQIIIVCLKIYLISCWNA